MLVCRPKYDCLSVNGAKPQNIVQSIFIAGTVTPASRHTESQSVTLNQVPETVTMKMSLFTQHNKPILIRVKGVSH